jgi:FG-GAP-like repeat/FG-GAP repeat
VKKLVALASVLALGASTGVAALFVSNSAPSFARARSYATGRGPLSIAIGDLNGDGKPDLATANPKTDTSTDTVSVLLNRGDGSFQGKRNYRAGRVPFAVAIGDLNGDGKEDLAVANFGGNTVSVFVNKGDGSFQAKRDYAAGEYPSSVAIGDVSGDRNPDLVIANRGGTCSSAGATVVSQPGAPTELEA